MKKNDNYYGVYDYKESDTFRPTEKHRIHKDYPYGKTLCTRSDSFCVIIRGGGNDLSIENNNPVACAQRKRENGQTLEVSNREQANAITTVQKDSLVANQLRIRKLTPRECFRLMGLKDEDIDLVMENQTNSSAYHLAGDSIVTTCLMAIFGELLGIDWKEQFDPKKWWVE